MEGKSKIRIFLDDHPQPIAEVMSPINFALNTTKLVDGPHTLKIVGKDPTGKEGVRVIPFVVRNGPAIDVEGITEDAVVDGVIPIMVNAYGKGNQQSFLIEGSETPQSIPSWLWVLIIAFAGWALYYLFRYFGMP